MNSNRRPKNLDLTTIKFPLPALTSITHRVSGVILFVAVAFMLCALASSLESQASFDELKSVMNGGLAKFITWGILSALGYHFVAGIKHLLMDLGVGETKESGKVGAIITFVLAAIVIVLAGVWVW